MKNLLAIVMLSAIVVGCSHNEVAPATAATPPPKCSEPKDNFDAAGQATASGSRYVWNEAKQAYDWATNDENQARARKAWEATKEAASNFYNKK